MQDVKLQKHYSKVVEKFNAKPKDGIKLLLATKQLEASTTADIARFLHNARGLNKKKIGEILGEHEEFYTKILDAFLDYMNLQKVAFDAALRLVLSRFVLPGEAQKIDRIMCKFAQRYHRDNPGIFPHEDTAYMLAFSLIMLNTDLHSNQIKRKMTKEQFVKNNSNIPGQVDLPVPFLETMYDTIAQHEIKMDQAFSGADKQGYLNKIKGKKTKPVGKIWVVLKDKRIFWFKSDQDAYEACDPKAGTKKPKLLNPPAFDLTDVVLKDGANRTQFEIVLPDGTSHAFQTETEDEQQSWIEAISDMFPVSPYTGSSAGGGSSPIAATSSPQSQANRTKGHLASAPTGSSSPGSSSSSSSSLHSSSSSSLSSSSLDGWTACPVTGSIDLPPGTSFEALNQLASMCSLGAKSNLAEIRRLYGQGAVIEAPIRFINIFILVQPTQKKQYVVFTGVKWDNAMTLKHDLASCSPGEASKYYELFLTAKSHCDNAKKFLKKELPVTLVGHSMGGAIALLAAHILMGMKYKIDSVVTFGQPSVLLPADIEAFKKIKSTRVRIVTDPIPLLFPGCRHLGLEIVLLGDDQFTFPKSASLPLPPQLYPILSGEDLKDDRLQNHHIDYYCRALRHRQSQAVGVLLGERT